MGADPVSSLVRLSDRRAGVYLFQGCARLPADDAFVIVTYTAATVVYFIYPTQQLLRPEAFAHDNALTRAVAWFYTFDTNTNVCPSLHVIGSRRGAVRAAGRPAAPETGVVAGGVRASGAVHQPFHGFLMKQHSILDVLCALPVCALGWWLCYGRPGRHG